MGWITVLPFDSSRHGFAVPLVAQGIRPVEWLAMSEPSARREAS